MTPISHAPPGYACPFCLLLAGVVNEHVWSRAEDIVYQDDLATAFISAAGSPNNPGHVLVIPNRHIEHLYDLPEREAAAIFRLTRAVARALKATSACAGVSTRQHNEPAGNQDVWHYHVHVFPRFVGDDLYAQPRVHSTPEQRQPHAERLRTYLAAHPEVFLDPQEVPA